MIRVVAIAIFLSAAVAGQTTQQNASGCSGNPSQDTAWFQTQVAGAGGNPITIKIPFQRDLTKLCKLNSITFPANVALDLSEGGIQVSSGQTVSIQGPIIAPAAKQIFFNALSGQGTLVLRGTVYPDWWLANSAPGQTDMAPAISAADASVCSGALDRDGVSVAAQGSVKFNSASYRVNSGLNLRGAPWIGEGPNNTILDYYGSGPAIDALGTRAARRHLNISNMSILGSHARNGGYGLRLGWNQRSFQALNHVNFEHFPSYGLYFADENTQMSFYDVAIIGCATASNSGIGIISDGTKHFYQINWFNLQLENNGKVGSRVAGGIEADGVAAVQQWSFFGGIFQSNRGAAEVRFTNAINIGLFGVYAECDPAATGVIDGLVFAGVSTAVLSNVNIYSSGAHAGSAISIRDYAKISIDNLRVLDGPGGWTTFISATEASQAWILSLGYLAPNSPVSIATGARLFWPPR